MKRAILWGILLVASGFGMVVRGADPYIGNGMADKGMHGLVNVPTCWMEIPTQTAAGYREGLHRYCENWPAYSRTRGTVRGIFRGTYHTVGRLVLGAYQLVGFWAANPRTNAGHGLLLNAEYGWERGSDQTFDSAQSCVDALGKKFERGATNLVCGVAEFPNQMRIGFAEGVALDGFVKGVWFSLSRVWCGAYDIVSLPLPGAEDTEGYAFEQEKPWGD